MRQRSKKQLMAINLIVILGVILLSSLPLWIVKEGKFGGVDGEAEVAIAQINNDYRPWVEPIIKPASGEVESLLFALQAAIGASVIAYGFGYLQGRSNKQRDNSP